MSGLRTYLAIIVSLVAVMTCSLVRAEAALGMVLDVQGNGKMEVNGTTSKLQLLAYLQPKMQITLEAGAKASLSLYATRSVYQLAGPATVTIEKDGVTSLQGQKAVVRPMAEKLVRAAETSNVIAGAVRMRQVPPRIVTVTPENNSLLLGQRPAFNWISAEAAEFDISIADMDEKLIVSEKTKENNWQLPEKIKLEEGAIYRWQVTYISTKDGKTYTARAEFKMASKAEFTSLNELKPEDNAGIEDWVMYAAMLQSKRAFGEARQAWQQIARQRPDLQKLSEAAP
ncbi:hypothetical protein ACO0LG_20550 [Undibacterium sp. Ji42W]|uniref:hypothetical protein n=1 Tax=Undibacterium sp. Ji42W TaxID=3413039 RepID=UPI003BF107F9